MKKRNLLGLFLILMLFSKGQKLFAEDIDLTDLIVNNGKLTVKGVETYTVYNTNGVKVADVKANISNTSIDLMPGVYIVKTKTAGIFKVAVK